VPQRYPREDIASHGAPRRHAINTLLEHVLTFCNPHPSFHHRHRMNHPSTSFLQFLSPSPKPISTSYSPSILNDPRRALNKYFLHCRHIVASVHYADEMKQLLGWEALPERSNSKSSSIVNHSSRVALRAIWSSSWPESAVSGRFYPR